jgi:hypothetical protein
LKVIDAPGLCDPELVFEDVIRDAVREVGFDQTIDAALIVIKTTDCRASI